jgi:hypothetical protein
MSALELARRLLLPINDADNTEGRQAPDEAAALAAIVIAEQLERIADSLEKLTNGYYHETFGIYTQQGDKPIGYVRAED